MKYNIGRRVTNTSGTALPSSRGMYGKAAILKRYGLYSKAPQYNSVCPQLKDVKMCIKTLKVKEKVIPDDNKTRMLLDDLYMPSMSKTTPGDNHDAFE